MKTFTELNWKEVIPFQFNEAEEVKTAFEPLITKLLQTVLPSEEPTLVHMLGIPGAGKTTYWKQNQHRFADFLWVGFDRIMEMLPAYQADVTTLGLKEAFARWEIPARIAGYELLLRAMEQKVNIFFDHGGTPELHLALIAEAKKMGYHTKMYYIKCDTDTAIKRVVAREKEIQRHTPKELIINRAPLVQQRAKQFRQLVDEFIEVN